MKESTISTIINGLNSPDVSPGAEKTDDTGLDNRRFSFIENGDPLIGGLDRGELLRSLQLDPFLAGRKPSRELCL
jgi:hypothetical protein